MKVLLMDRQCWDYVSGKTTVPGDTATEQERQKFRRIQERSYTTIYQGVERQFLTLIADTTDGKAAWETLKRNFEPTTRARLASLIDEFYEMKFTGETNIGLFCKKLQEQKQLILDAGFDMPDELVCFQLIRKLPPEFDNLVQQLYRLDKEEFNFNNIEGQLITEAGRLNLKKKDEGQSLVLDAYLTKERITNQRRASSTQSSGVVLDPSSKYADTREDATRSKMCSYCNRKGHLLRDCFKRKNDQQRTAGGQRRQEKWKQNLKTADHPGGFYSEDPEDQCYSVLGESRGDDDPTTDLDEWLVDTAATSHFCKEKDWFDNYKELPPTDALIGDKNCTSKILGVGDITFYVKDGNKFVKMILYNVLYAPNMRRNLISGAKIDIAKYKINWSNDKMILYKENGDYFLTVPRVNKFYIMYGLPSTKFESYNVYTSKELNIELAHRRFGHINAGLIIKMSKNNVVKGLEKLKGNLDPCISCNVAKLTRVSFKPRNERLSKEVLNRVSMDVWGPSPVKSLGGKSYFLSIIDEYSRYVTVFIIEKKSDVFNCFKQYLVNAEKQLNKKLRCVRFDNGTEFVNKEFEMYLKNFGIKIERTSIESPEMNSITERFNRTVIEGVRAMLHESGLQLRFWAEAVNAFVHISNRCEHKLTDGLTPYEIWTGRKPSVRHFRAFGSLAYAYIPKSRRNKLNNRADIGIFVGYASTTKGYRVFIPSKRKVVETIHVKVDETKNGVVTLFGQKTRESISYLGFDSYSDIEDLCIPKDEKSETAVEKSDISSTTLLDIDLSKWKRVERPRKKSSRIDVYYYPPSGKPRLRSLKKTAEYCEKERLNFKAEIFNFKPISDVPKSRKLSENESSSSNTDEANIPESDFFEEAYSIEIPKTYEDTLKVPEKQEWQKAMLDELKVIEDRKVWELVDKPPNVNLIGNRWVYTVKKDDKNEIQRYKARLVALGYKQRFNIEYTDWFSPVVNFSVIRLLFVLFVSVLSWQHLQLDVKSAYLYGNLNEKIYMSQPKGYEVGGPNQVCLLKKSIYGLHQSGRQWNIELDNILKSIGFRNNSWCNCVYQMKDIVLLAYVDDLVLFGRDQYAINKTVNLLKAKLDVKILGKVKYLLGVNFETINNVTYLSQNTYIDKLIKRFNELPKSYVNLPIKVGQKLPIADKDSKVEETELMKKYPYRTLIGCLSFLASRSRPDIEYAVNTMSQFNSSYTKEHWEIVVNIFNYVCNTKHCKINLTATNNCGLVAFSDANWGSDLTFRHSTGGYLIKFCDVPIAWKSTKQKMIALSSMEAEFVALTESTKELLWFENIVCDLDVYNFGKPIQFCDNLSAMYFCKNNLENAKTKHIDIKLKFIRQLVNEDKFELKYVNSKSNIADFLTKPISKEKLDFFKKNVFG